MKKHWSHAILISILLLLSAWVSLSAGEGDRLDIRPESITRPAIEQGNRISNSIGMEFIYISPGAFIIEGIGDVVY